MGWDLVPIDDERHGLPVRAAAWTRTPPPSGRTSQFGDAIVEIDNTRVKNVADTCDIIGSKSSGDRLKIVGLGRLNGTVFTIRARLR